MLQGGNCKLRSTAEYDFDPLQSLPLAKFPHLFDFALDQIALQHAEGLNKENAVQVIDLVAERPRQQILAANLKRLAFGVLRFHGDELSRHLIAAKPSCGEASVFRV